MPRGGFRVGAGRKPKPKTGVVLGMDGSRRSAEVPPSVEPEVRDSLLQAPTDLTAEQSKVWTELAPKAVDARTLTPNTLPAFRALVLLAAIVKQLDERIALVGCGTLDSLGHLRERRGQAAQLSAALKDFALSPFGKPTPSAKPKAANPFASAFGGPEK